MVVVESSRRVYHGSATMFSMRHRSAPENDRFPVCCVVAVVVGSSSAFALATGIFGCFRRGGGPLSAPGRKAH